MTTVEVGWLDGRCSDGAPFRSLGARCGSCRSGPASNTAGWRRTLRCVNPEFMTRHKNPKMRCSRSCPLCQIRGWAPSTRRSQTVIGHLIRDRSRATLKSRWWMRRGWQEHYNIACTYGVSLVLDQMRNKPDRVNPIIERSVRHLQRAVSAADSQFAGGTASWLRNGDQDLDDIRVSDTYVTFVDRYLPHRRPTIDVPPDVAVLTMTNHLTRPVKELACWRQKVLCVPGRSRVGCAAPRSSGWTGWCATAPIRARLADPTRDDRATPDAARRHAGSQPSADHPRDAGVGG